MYVHALQSSECTINYVLYNLFQIITNVCKDEILVKYTFRGVYVLCVQMIHKVYAHRLS